MEKKAPVCQIPYQDLNLLLANECCPCAFLDVERFQENLAVLGEEIAPTGKKVRIGTKSIRVPKLIKMALDQPYTNGVFLFHPNEFQYLQEHYKINDFLLAYPIMSRAEADLCSKSLQRDPNSKVSLMVDDIEHLQLLERSAAALNVTLGIIIDCDFSINFLGQMAGVYRSPLQNPQEIVGLAKKVKDYPHLSFEGIMGYEAQEAGIGDDKFIFSKMKQASRIKVNKRRSDIVQSLDAEGLHPLIVNGGGSGCFPLTAAEPGITEVTIGSALFKSYIFDNINNLAHFKPSLFMALRVVRKPRKGIATAYSGGYICSGSNRSPQIVLPENCHPTSREGFGEVQTPILYDPNKIEINLGDLIICRFAKAGEPLERFNEVLAISQGKMIDRYKTYRGVGLWLG